MSNFFDEDDLEFAGKIGMELSDEDINKALSGMMFDNAAQKNAHENSEQVHAGPTSITANDHVAIQNLDDTYANLEPTTFSNTVNGNINDIPQINNNSNAFRLTPLTLTAPVNSSMPLSLPPTPYSASESSSPQTERNRKEVRKCCKEMKAWLLNEPRSLQKAQEIFSKYSIEIDEALNMGTPRSGRPHIRHGSLTVEQRSYFCLNYGKIKRCKMFIAAFVNMYKDGHSGTMLITDLPYPEEIDIPRQRTCRRNTQ